MTPLSKAKQKFSRSVTEWGRAGDACSATYMAWQKACRRLEDFKIKKNNAWNDLLEKDREATSGEKGGMRDELSKM